MEIDSEDAIEIVDFVDFESLRTASWSHAVRFGPVRFGARRLAEHTSSG